MFMATCFAVNRVRSHVKLIHCRMEKLQREESFTWLQKREIKLINITPYTRMGKLEALHYCYK